jgi:hypothetical protein
MVAATSCSGEHAVWCFYLCCWSPATVLTLKSTYSRWFRSFLIRHHLPAALYPSLPAVPLQGETAAPHDVTSNVERSKHLEDPQQAKIYDAEVRCGPVCVHLSGAVCVPMGMCCWGWGLAIRMCSWVFNWNAVVVWLHVGLVLWTSMQACAGFR